MCEEVSLFVSDSLDSLGYNEEMLSCRRNAYSWINRCYTGCLEGVGFDAIIDGSMAEGLSTPLESSCDILFIRKNVTCNKNGTDQSKQKYPEDILMFKSEQDEVPPGYTRLTLHHKPGGMSYEDDVVSSTFGIERVYLWSSYYFNKMKDKFKARNKPFQEKGPLVGHSMNAHIGKFSINFPLQYVDEDLPRQMRSRQWQYGWPTEGVIEVISRQKVFVVPQSSPNSEIPYLEWKICYRQAELLLFKELNMTQVKLYILLKMITDSTLRPIAGNITPYLIKNIVFWMVHMYQLDIFHDRHLVLLVLTALGMMYNGIKCGNIPCFLETKRNLIAQSLDMRAKHDLLRILSILLQERACMFLRCEKLQRIMTMKFASPEIIDRYKSQRNKLEKMLLILATIQAKYVSHADKVKPYIKHIIEDEDWIRVAKAVYDSVLPGWMDRHVLGENTSHIVISRIREILG